MDFWTWLSSRPSWKRVARVSEQLFADAVITTIAHMIHWLPAANFAINGYYALKHLIAAHRTDDAD